jgi:hypothetical protein
MAAYRFDDRVYISGETNVFPRCHIQMGTVILQAYLIVPGISRPEREPNQSTPSSNDSKNAWNYVSLLIHFYRLALN